MSDQNQRTAARSMADVLAVGAEGQALWPPHELAAMLRHQLAAPLALDLEALGGKAAIGLRAAPAAIRTFGDLLFHDDPPLELLELVKEFAKIAPRRGEARLPEEIAAVLYTLSIVVAMRKHGRRITELDDRALRERLDWALGQPWLDRRIGQLLRQSRQAMDTAVSASGLEETAVQRRPPAMSTVQAAALGQLGEYVLLEKLGEGGMGTVYKALHTELDRIVAVKVLRPGQMADDEAVARFRREMKAAGRLDHPHIVRAHDARKIGQNHVLVMEFVDGLDLTALVGRLGPLPVADACEIIRQAADGLACAHQHGLVHRDVKPSNLMLTRAGQVKVLDLGLARLPSAGSVEMTAVGQLMGTPDYMAPEQFSDSHAIDIRADIYSLGCTLYMLLCGRAPFADAGHDSLLRKMHAHAAEAPPPVRQFRADVPEAVRQILDKMMAKPPAERFGAPAEVVEALGPFAAGADLGALMARTTGKAPPPLPLAQPTTARRTDAARRKRRAVVGGLVALIVVAILLGTMWLRHRKAHRSQDVAAKQLTQDSPLSLGEGQGVRAAIAGNSAIRPHPSPLPEGEGTRIETALQPLRGRIVLSWSGPGRAKPDLWLFNPDGKARRNITDTPRSFEIHPKFSPDGRRIAFIRGETPLESNGVWICDANGGRQRQVVTAGSPSERFASPVWLSNTRLCYARDPKLDRSPDGELWQVDLDGGQPRLLFRLQEALGEGAGAATDVSPDGRQLAIIAQTEAAWPTADVYVSDLEGKHVSPVWVDRPDRRKDARALWSPDGKRIAWHHNFTAGADVKPTYCGVGLARLEGEGRWTARFSPDENVQITPLAWSPRGDGLLCASPVGKETSPVAVFLMDDQFRRVRVLFEIEGGAWFSNQRDYGRLADWTSE